VLKPFRIGTTAPAWRWSPWHGAALAAALIASLVGEARPPPARPAFIATIAKYAASVAGFALNIAMSFLAMAIGTACPSQPQIAALAAAIAAAGGLVHQFRSHRQKAHRDVEREPSTAAASISIVAMMQGAPGAAGLRRRG